MRTILEKIAEEIEIEKKRLTMAKRVAEKGDRLKDIGIISTEIEEDDGSGPMEGSSMERNKI